MGPAFDGAVEYNARRTEPTDHRVTGLGYKLFDNVIAPIDWLYEQIGLDHTAFVIWFLNKQLTEGFYLNINFNPLQA